MDAAHTPTPWHEATRGPNNMPVIGAKGMMLAHVCTGDEFQSEADANAEFILRACNSHDQVVTALKRSHMAIDRLMARLIELDPTFSPSKSDALLVLRMNNEALAAAGAA